MSLFWRIFLLNAAVVVVAMALLLGPYVTVSKHVRLGEAEVVVSGAAAMLVINALLVRFLGLAPLNRLSQAMTTADLTRREARAAVVGTGEVADLTRTFHSMLDRLESERAASSARILGAQEAERQRIARELHDEVGQTLTAVLLQLKHAADRAPAALSDELRLAQETTRGSLDEIRRIARALRPGLLEELGLASALRALAAEFTLPGLTVRHRIDRGLPPLDPESELVLYRIAQEALTNLARHSGATQAELRLRPGPEGLVELLISDNGKGLGQAPEGNGLRGMRERALLSGAELSFGSGPYGGTEVRLVIATMAGSPA
ncbi:HAMP domain-containing sensor histidine kinase [Streptomyces sp. NPDC001691]|uniref:HAMP domain-containing sensor histidine kinase n=1 Tax=unclassified Streptomyces TaxID=2593676 RepID=UPI000DEAED2E|nr:HAMP domain-containing sensor histidine kinase [Streptomyces sp. SDr-06]RCH70044.1 sensor histidine kinase [Streptomyces sp. SDr-06]